MKIAFVVPYVPNLIRTRPYNLINQLVALGNEVVVFTLGWGKRDQEDAERLRSRVTDLYYKEQSVWQSLWNSIRAVPSRLPLQTVYSWNSELAKQLVDEVSDYQNGFDVVHVEHLRGAKYGQYVKTRLPHVPIVWDSVDCISYLFKQASTRNTVGYSRFITRFELGRTSRMEGELVSEFDHVLVTSETDRNELLALRSPNSIYAPISVLANGVDLEYFHPNPAVEKDSGLLVFSGKMSYHANIAMAKFLVNEIMPLVWVKHPNIRLMIVGKDPTAEVSALGRDSRVIVTGTVDDIRPYIWKATCAVVPLVYGAGIQNKILEAMACGVPVVTTSNALSSLHVTSGKELLVGNGVFDFSNCVNKLLDDQKLQVEIGSNGASYVKTHHNWVEVAKQLTFHYEKTIITRNSL